MTEAKRIKKPTAQALDPELRIGIKDAYGTEREWRVEGTYTIRMRISFSLRLIFLMMLRRPILEVAQEKESVHKGDEEGAQSHRTKD